MLFTNGIKLIILYELDIQTVCDNMKESVFFLFLVSISIHLSFAENSTGDRKKEADWISQIMPPSSTASNNRKKPVLEPIVRTPSESTNLSRSETPTQQAQSELDPNSQEIKPEAPKGVVTRSVFTTEIINKEPFDDVVEVANSIGKIYFFTEFKQLNGHSAKHLWYYDNKLVAEIPFTIQSNRWRAWSSKSLKPDQRGSWRVKVVTADGEVLSEKSFTYIDVSGLEVSTD